MKISIVIPVFNGEKYLAGTLLSISQQTRLPDELIISDDCSQDGTLEVVMKFIQNSPYPIALVGHMPSGITDNYLYAIKLASGDVILIADQDDIWLPNRIEMFEKCFIEHPDVAVVSANSELVDESLISMGRTIYGSRRQSEKTAASVNEGDDFLKFLKGMPLLAHSLAIRGSIKSAIVNHKPSGLDGWWFENWAVAISSCYGRLHLIPDALTLYRQHPSQTAGAPKKTFFPVSTGATYTQIINRLNFIQNYRQSLIRGTLFCDEELNRRGKLLGLYIGFLEDRARLTSEPIWHRIILSIRLLLIGRYHQFAKGWGSFAKDCLCL